MKQGTKNIHCKLPYVLAKQKEQTRYPRVVILCMKKGSGGGSYGWETGWGGQSETTLGGGKHGPFHGRDSRATVRKSRRGPGVQPGVSHVTRGSPRDARGFKTATFMVSVPPEELREPASRLTPTVDALAGTPPQGTDGRMRACDG